MAPSISRLHALKGLARVVVLFLTINTVLSRAQPLPLDDVSFDQLAMKCVDEIVGLPDDVTPVEERLSEWCRQELRLLTGEMEAAIKANYQACVKRLPIDEEAPFVLGIHKACRQLAEDDVEGEYEIGRHFDYGWGLGSDPVKAAHWYEKAAKRGHAEAQHSLGLLHTGTGGYVFANSADSVKWFCAAAEQGHASSQCFLGSAYARGEGVPKNFAEAARWYRKAAIQGDGMAMTGLAGLHARGLGVEKSVIQAYAWCNVAATQGWGMAKTYRDELEEGMTPAQLSEGQALSMRLFELYGDEMPRRVNDVGRPGTAAEGAQRGQIDAK